MIVAGHFKKSIHVPDGLIVVTRRDEIVFVGPAHEIPDNIFATGTTTVHCNPALYDRIATAAAEKEEGIPYEPERQT